ncbi:WG repeat-containing protein, partial [Campylobacter sp. RM15925]|uniref:WG repeat-containing protein n=1 Tax=Campylobacter sp. RM15925 TaxID=1705724 RepID=UPI001474AE8E
MFDFLKSLFSAKDEEILEKVASIKATEGTSINKTNNLTKEIDANKAGEPLFKNKKVGKWGYINAKGEQIVECKFDEASDFSEGLAAVKKGYKWGFVNAKGEQVVECKFDYINDFKKGLAKVKKGLKQFTINTKGNFIVHDEYNNKIEVSGKFDYVCDFKEG